MRRGLADQNALLLVQLVVAHVEHEQTAAAARQESDNMLYAGEEVMHARDAATAEMEG